MTANPSPTETPGPAPHTAANVVRWWPLVSGIALVALVAGGGALIAARASALEVDAEWMEELVEHRNPIWEVPAFVMNFLGGGWFGVFVVPLLVIAAFVIAKRYWAAAYFLVASILSAGLVQLLKNLFGRARPLDQIVQSDFGSFPSGHVANAATLAVALGILLWRVWIWVAGAVYTVVMLLSRTYLGAHWLTDTLGGLVLGAAVAVMVWAPIADRLQAESAHRTALARRSKVSS